MNKQRVFKGKYGEFVVWNNYHHVKKEIKSRMLEHGVPFWAVHKRDYDDGIRGGFSLRYFSSDSREEAVVAAKIAAGLSEKALKF